MKQVWAMVGLVLALVGLMAHPVLAQQAEPPIVRAVLFYSPTCPHCHTVINETLIPLMQRYGDRLQIVAVNITEPNGRTLFEASTELFQVPTELSGVPRLVVGETVLVGSRQIPEQFPGIVEAGLAAGGIDWPPITGLAEAMAAAGEAMADPTPTTPSAAATEASKPTQEATPAPTTTPTAPALALGTEGLPPAAEGSAGMPEGGWLAATLLGGMLLALAFTALRLWRPGVGGGGVSSWLIPVLAIAGLGVAGYLAYVELSQAEAVCGPVGECNLVQSSPYAKILGIPVAVLGMASYGAILVLWAVARFGGKRWDSLASWSLLVLTVAGVLFSVYLTVLELAVIHAVCAWCLTSALLTTILMLVVVLQLTTGERAQHGASPQRAVPT